MAGQEAGENFLQAYPDMNMVVSINDDTMHGVYEAFAQAGLTNSENIGLFFHVWNQKSKEYVAEGGIFKCVVDLELNKVGEIWLSVRRKMFLEKTLIMRKSIIFQ